MLSSSMRADEARGVLEAVYEEACRVRGKYEMDQQLLSRPDTMVQSQHAPDWVFFPAYDVVSRIQ